MSYHSGALGEDAFGSMLFDHFEGRKRDHFIERDDNYLEASSASLYFAEYDDWPAIERAAIPEEVFGRVLDVGCGAGRHALYLQQQGFEVMGIDPSPLALEVCRRRGVLHMQNILFESINRLKPFTFDTVLMMGHNFGLFENPEKARHLLRTLHFITNPGAKIIATTRDPLKTDDPVHLRYHALNRKRGRAVGQLKLRVRYRTLIGRWFDYLFISEDTMRDILQGTDWEMAQVVRDNGSSSYLVILKETR